MIEEDLAEAVVLCEAGYRWPLTGEYESDDELRNWVQQGVDFALSLPPK